MGRKRKWKSDAERMKAQREARVKARREAKATPSPSPDPGTPDPDENPEVEPERFAPSLQELLPAVPIEPFTEQERQLYQAASRAGVTLGTTGPPRPPSPPAGPLRVGDVLPAPNDPERALRDQIGYAPSETRTERQRSDAAARMLGRDPQAYWDSRHDEAERVQGQTEEEYVQRELAITESQLGTSPHVNMARSEAYLRWRWHAVRSGEVASL